MGLRSIQTPIDAWILRLSDQALLLLLWWLVPDRQPRVIDDHPFGEFVDEARDAVAHAIRGGDDLVGFLWLKRHAGAIRATGGKSDRACRLALGIAAIGVAAARSDTETVRSAATRLLADQDKTGDLPDMLVRWLAVAQAEAHLAAGAPQAAIDCVVAGTDHSGFAGALERVVLARAHLALDHPQPATTLLAPLLEPALPYLVQTVEARILTAVAAGRMHHTAAALEAFTDAVNLAHQEELVRPFTTAGSSIIDLLTQHRRVVADHREFTHTVLAAITAITAPALQEPASSAAFEQLTDRVLLVLRYLPTRLKAGDIAADLYLSVYTVKSHCARSTANSTSPPAGTPSTEPAQ